MDEFRASFTWKTERPDFESILGLAFGDADTAKLASSGSSSNGLSHTVAVMAAGPERMVRDVERLTIDARHVFLRESFKV
ncbi:hypothetical protein BC831DRAFT_482074 [Entophlyctis helioformis]|nr:hypothetical protein BC831DRAFT_482074 [Entophlyctis helioformis]